MAEIAPPARLQTGTSLKLRARAGWLACRVECTPGKATLEVTLPVKAGALVADAPWARMFAEARSRLPLRGGPGTFSATAVFTGRSRSMDPAPPFRREPSVLFYPDAPGQVSAFLAPGSDETAVLSAAAHGARDRVQSSCRDSRGSSSRRVPGEQAFEVDVPVVPGPRRGPGIPRGPAAGLRRRLDPQPDAVRASGDLAESDLSFKGEPMPHGTACCSPSACSSRSGSSPACWWGFAPAGIFWAGGSSSRIPRWSWSPAILFFLIGLNLFGVFEIGTMFTRRRLVGGVQPRTKQPVAAAASFATGCSRRPSRPPARRRSWAPPLGYALTHSLGRLARGVLRPCSRDGGTVVDPGRGSRPGLAGSRSRGPGWKPSARSWRFR